MNAVAVPQFTPEQIDDIAKLLEKLLTRGNIVSIATSALGRDALPEAGNEVGDRSALAQRLVRTMQNEGRLVDAVALLRREAHVNGRLMLGLNHILQGRRLGDDAATQAFVNDYEPFLSSASMQTLLSQVMRSVCAVWLGPPYNRIVGTGFLIGAQHILTNFHVIEPMLGIQADGQFGSQGIRRLSVFYLRLSRGAAAQRTASQNNQHEPGHERYRCAGGR
jgi:hypothetical protein